MWDVVGTNSSGTSGYYSNPQFLIGYIENVVKGAALGGSRLVVGTIGITVLACSLRWFCIHEYISQIATCISESLGSDA